MLHPTLYKRTSAGKIQTWFAETDGGKYRTTSGQLYGAQTTTEWTICETKNPGKRNERSAADQALSEVESMYAKKRRTDYFDNVDDVDTSDRLKPMLATPLDKVEIGDDEQVFAQPKYDGFRCVSKGSNLFTREGLPFETIPHINEILRTSPEAPGGAADGEAYNHDLRDNFNKISSILRDGTPDEEQKALVAQVQYYVYDLPNHPGTQAERLEALALWVKSVNNPFIVLAPTVTILGRDIPEYLEARLADGYEGGIVRKRDAKYENKRSKGLIKVKKILEEDFTIVDIFEGVGNGAGKAKSVLMQTADGQEFSVGVIGDDSYTKDLFARRAEFRGQRGSVKFLNYTPRGVPRGGKLKAVRFG